MTAFIQLLMRNHGHIMSQTVVHVDIIAKLYSKEIQTVTEHSPHVRFLSPPPPVLLDLQGPLSLSNELGDNGA